MKKTIIVMPVANEEATMQQVIDEIMSLPYDNLFLYPVIDSYSKDKTEEIIRNSEARYGGRVKCIFYKESRGLISCYLYGFKCALADGAQRIIEMDGGGSHSPKELPAFIAALDEGYQCVWGSRFMRKGDMENQPLYRYILSGGGTWLSNLVLGTRLKDMTSGYEAFQADVLKNMNLDKFMSTGHMYQTEMKYYCRNYSYKEIPIHYLAGDSTLKFKAVVEALGILFKLKGHQNEVMSEGNAKQN